MRAAARKTNLHVAWSWPLDVTSYDRKGDLTAAELSMLENVIGQYSGGKTFWPPESWEVLERLVRPINDVNRVMRLRNRDCGGIRNYILRETYRLRKTFWAWTKDDWVDVIGVNATSFLKRSRRSAQYRQVLKYIYYALCGFTDLRPFGALYIQNFAIKVFGRQHVEAAVNTIVSELLKWGYEDTHDPTHFPASICTILLANRSPLLKDLNDESFKQISDAVGDGYLRDYLVRVSRALKSLGIINKALARKPSQYGKPTYATDDVPMEWAQWCQRWRDTSTEALSTRKPQYYQLLKVGRWLAKKHPEVSSPANWTRELCVDFLKDVGDFKIGDFAHPGGMAIGRVGKPLSARSKNTLITGLRGFLYDIQEWEWIPRRFDPVRHLKTPSSIRSLIGPDPRVISDEIWAKLLWAGINLCKDDLPAGRLGQFKNRRHAYPIELVRALVMVWLFAGLRANEIRRLRVGCIRWLREDVSVPVTDEVLPKDAVCLLDVPVNKTGTSFTKPVDPILGEAVFAWEKVRPEQPAAIDHKTGELVNYLFFYRGKQFGTAYINECLIPILCKKAGVPEADARGKITSHRARSTIASQLYNGPEPMSLFELQEWLGHRNPSSTQHYVKISPTKLAKSYSDAGYFKRNVRVIEVLIDRDAIANGEAAAGQPWEYYDLGHGFCSYPQFVKCPHRLACPKCDFYIPKGSSLFQLIESKGNIERMLKEIKLTDEERTATEGDIKALDRLCNFLKRTPTPSGQTPEQLIQITKREDVDS